MSKIKLSEMIEEYGDISVDRAKVLTTVVDELGFIRYGLDKDKHYVQVGMHLIDILDGESHVQFDVNYPGEIFETREDALEYIDDIHFITHMNEVFRSGGPIDWDDTSKMKYYISYDRVRGHVVARETLEQVIGVPFCNKRSIVDGFINKYEEDLIRKYTTVPPLLKYVDKES